MTVDLGLLVSKKVSLFSKVVEIQFWAIAEISFISIFKSFMQVGKEL